MRATLRVADREQDGKPRAGRGAADHQRQRAKLFSKFMQIVRPDFMLRTRAIEGDIGCAAIAPVVQQHAIA